MVTTIVPPHWKPSNLSFFFLIMFNSKKSSTTQNFKKVFIKISCEVFPFPIFPPFQKPTRFVWGENEFNPPFWGPSVSQALHYAAYHGHLSCVTELMKSNPRKVQRLKKPTEVLAAGRFFAIFFFVRSFFLSHPRFRKWSVFVPGSCFWFIVFDWYLLIEFEYGSLFLMYGVWKLQTGLSMRFPLRGGMFFVIVSFVPPQVIA